MRGRSRFSGLEVPWGCRIIAICPHLIEKKHRFLNRSLARSAAKPRWFPSSRIAAWPTALRSGDCDTTDVDPAALGFSTTLRCTAFNRSAPSVLRWPRGRRSVMLKHITYETTIVTLTRSWATAIDAVYRRPSHAIIALARPKQEQEKRCDDQPGAMSAARRHTHAGSAHLQERGESNA